MADIRTIRIQIDGSGAIQGVNQIEEGLNQAAAAAKKADAEADKLVGTYKAVGAAIGAAVAGTLFATDQILKSIANYQDLADAMGTTASGVSSLQTAADMSGTSMDKISGISQKLTKSLLDINKEGNATATALKAIGISAEEFKRLSPEDQLKQVADQMAGFEDGTEKSAIAMALFGKSGAEMMPFFNDLSEAQNRNISLTAEQIAQADEYAKAQDRLISQVKSMAMVAASEAAPAMTILTNALGATIKQMMGLDSESGSLAGNTGIADFAMGAVKVLGYVGNMVQFVARTLQSLGLSIGAIAAMATQALHLDFAGVKATHAAANNDIKALWTTPWMSANIAKEVEAYKKGVASLKTAGPDKPKINFDPNKFDNDKKAKEEADKAIKKAKDDSEKAAKAQEALFTKLKSEADGLIGKYDPLQKKTREYNEDLEKLGKLANMSAADLKKLGLTKEEVTALTEKAIRIHGEEKSILEENIDSVRQQISLMGVSKEARDAEAASISLSNKLKSEGLVVDQAQLATYKALVTELKQKQKEESFKEGQDDKIKSLKDEMALVGVYGNQRNRQAEEQAVRRQAEKAGIADVEGAVSKQMQAYDELTEKVRAHNSVMSNGAREALQGYIEKAADVASAARDATNSVLSSMEDKLAEFFRTGKFGFKDFVQVINNELSKVAARQLIGLGLEMFSSYGGGKAIGGPVMGGTTYMVGENGPEMFTPPTSGTIIPNNMLNNTSSTSFSFNLGGITIAPGSKVTAADLQAMGRQIESNMMATITDEMRSGGLFAR